MSSFTKKTIASLLLVVITFSIVFSDCMLTNAATSKQIVLDQDTLNAINVYYGSPPFTYQGITIKADVFVSFISNGIGIQGNGVSLTFSSSVGVISRIEIRCSDVVNISDDWVMDGDILTWCNTPSDSVSLSSKYLGDDVAPEGYIENISSIVIYIGDITVNSISLYKDGKPAEPFTLYSRDNTGNKALLSTVILPDAADKTVVWSSSDTDVATVDSTGLVTGVGGGEATITATATNGNNDASDDKSASCKVLVEDTIMPDSGPTGKAIQLVNSFNPSGGIKGKGQDHIYFGELDDFFPGFDTYWRVLDSEKSNAGEQNCMFLMTENLLGVAEKYNSNYMTHYDRAEEDDNSDLTSSWSICYSRTWVQFFYRLCFSSAEQGAVKKTRFIDSRHVINDLEFSGNTLDDEVFYLSLKELSDPSYGFTDEASRAATFQGSPGYYWTRSAHDTFTVNGREWVSVAGIDSLGGFGLVQVTLPLYLRYGMNLDMSKVLFTSPAVGGKKVSSIGSLNAVSDYSGSDWKLTVLDTSRQFSVSNVHKSGDTVSFRYSNAVEGDNEYISAIIMNAAGTVTYYGRLAEASATAETLLTFDLGYTVNDGDILYIFNEHINGDKVSDYSSELVKIKLTPEPHSWKWIIDVEPTCGEYGIRHEVCTVCGLIQNENSPAPPTGIHEFEWFVDKEPTHYEPGYQHAVCKICGVTMYENTEIEPLPLPQFKTHSLVLSGEIGVNYFMDLPSIGELDYENSYMEFKVSGKNGATTKDFFDPDHKNQSDEFFGFTCYVNSIQMAETISATFHFFLGDEEKTLDLEDYSVAQYLYTLITDDQLDGTVKQLAVATAEYGYYAQEYLSERNGWRFGEDHEHMPQLNSMCCDGYSDQDYIDVLNRIGELEEDLGDLGIVRNVEGSGIETVTFALVLDKATGIMLYLEPEKDYFDHDIRVTFGDDYENFEDLELQEDGRYHVYIQGISAHELADMFTVHVRAKEEFDIKVCALSYVKAVLNSDTTNDKLKNLAVAIYNYYDKTMLFRWANQYTY